MADLKTATVLTGTENISEIFIWWRCFKMEDFANSLRLRLAMKLVINIRSFRMSEIVGSLLHILF
jgi:hypothetical protein